MSSWCWKAVVLGCGPELPLFAKAKASNVLRMENQNDRVIAAFPVPIIFQTTISHRSEWNPSIRGARTSDHPYSTCEANSSNPELVDLLVGALEMC